MASFDFAMLLLRAGFGLMLAAHGLNHWLGGGRIAGTAGWFESLGLRPGVLHAWLSVVTEVLGGVGLALGLLTPLCAAAGVSLMTVAIVTVHRHNGFWILKEGWEYTALVALTCLGIATLGAGRWSVDHVIDLDSILGLGTAGWHGALLAAIVGLGGSAALLGRYWRPGAASS